jgi:hypothetical protein
VHQRSPRLVEDGACCHGDLILALAALIKPSRTVIAIGTMTTSRTPVPPWPSKLEQVFHACFFIGKLPLELNKVQRLLLHYPATSSSVWGTLVIQLRSKGNNPFHYCAKYASPFPDAISPFFESEVCPNGLSGRAGPFQPGVHATHRSMVGDLSRPFSRRMFDCHPR